MTNAAQHLTAACAVPFSRCHSFTAPNLTDGKHSVLFYHQSSSHNPRTLYAMRIFFIKLKINPKAKGNSKSLEKNQCRTAYNSVMCGSAEASRNFDGCKPSAYYTAAKVRT